MMSKRDLKKREEIFKSLETKIEDPFFQCVMCKGKGSLIWDLETVDCVYCDGSGSKVEQLKNDIDHLRGRNESLHKEIDYLTNFIKSTSNCKTCGGDRMKTFGLGKCSECGIEGNCPWPG